MVFCDLSFSCTKFFNINESIFSFKISKVELFSLCEPEHSDDELDRMIAIAEHTLQKLDLHYRISLLAAQDCSFSSAKTYDIEVWMPARKEYYEVSSCSNCRESLQLTRHPQRSHNPKSLSGFPSLQS